MKEVIAENVLLCQQPFRQITRIEVTQDQAPAIAPRYELIHFASIDLELFVIEAMNQVACRFLGADVLLEIERLCWERWIAIFWRKSLVGNTVVHHRRQSSDYVALEVDLRARVLRVG